MLKANDIDASTSRPPSSPPPLTSTQSSLRWPPETWLDQCGAHVWTRDEQARRASHGLRILLHVNTEKAARDIKHVYLRGAKAPARPADREHSNAGRGVARERSVLRGRTRMERTYK